MDKKFGALSSSVDSQKLAKTVEGAVKLLGGIIAYFGYSSVTGDINSVAEQIGTVVTLGYSFYGASEMLFGMIRKLVVKFTAN
jgi:hypothetical protein